MATNRKPSIVLPGLIFLVCLVSGCSTPSAAGSSELERHYQFSEDLKKIMARMELLIHDRQLTGSEIDSLRARQGEIVQDLASQITRDSDKLLTGVDGRRITDLEKAQFQAIAGQLMIYAERFSYFSRHGSNADVERAFSEMEIVCDSCHRIYRDED
jgi:cytochrome c556